MEPLRWNPGHGVAVAMSLATDGDLRQTDLRRRWCSAHGIPEPAVARQVHGTRILSDPRTDAMPEADGLCAAGQAIGVFGADCPPLVLATPTAIAVVHCGWRGTAAGIVGIAAAALAAIADAPRRDWLALIGPGVHPDDYEVDAAVLAARTWPTGSLAAGRPGRAWLDLPAAIAADCRLAGIGGIARDAATTSRDPRLRSHRRDGPGHPQLLVAWRPSCAG